MKFSKSSKALMVITIVGIVGFGVYALDDWGMGYGHRGYGHMGPGWQRGWSGNQGIQGSLSDEEITRLDKERQAFFDDTRETRENLYQKELELRSEMAKKDPDAKMAVDLQKEISELESQLNQKRVEQRIKMQKENPELFAGRGYGQGRGYGKGGPGMGRGYGMGGGGMGRGFQGRGGGCWY